MLLKLVDIVFAAVVICFSFTGQVAACPTDWKKRNDNCYRRYDTRVSWEIAMSACEDQQASLVEIKSQDENKFVKDEFEGQNWLGISRCHSNSTCLSDFSAALFTNWANRQPDNKPKTPASTKNEDFAVMITADGTWFDRPKLEQKSYICKRPVDLCTNNMCNTEASTGCVNGVCQCKNGYSGLYCYDGPCDNNPCQNGGTCEDVESLTSGYNCTCINHYTGTNCEVPSPCETKKPCVNGDCENLNGIDYTCKCSEGWIGKNCDERPCDKRPCRNAKQCINKGSGYECVCLAGWEGQNCEKKGNAVGDPHYTTFDGKRYDFMGKCEYIYAKDCGESHAFEVLQQNEACGSATVSCTKSVRVFVKGIEVKMERSGVVFVDGIRVNLPWKMRDSQTSITSWSSGAIITVPKLLFSVSWDGGYYINVKINQRYESNMCGLMGNADGDPDNDFQLPDRSLAENIPQFGNSWKKNPRCVNGIVPADPCLRLGSTEHNAVKQKCGKMKQAPFRQCNGKITPDVGHIPNCEYDLCAMNAANPSAAWCRALETYDAACRSQDVEVNWKGKVGFEECGDPCASIPCFNGAKCENADDKEFKCVCPKGFSGVTCKNVDCKPGYISHGNICYKDMNKRPWVIAKCPPGDEFVLTEDEDENKFIYDNFVASSKQSFWMNARICGKGKLCNQRFGIVYYNNVGTQLPGKGCVAMPFGNGMKWVVTHCNSRLSYICKYKIFK